MAGQGAGKVALITGVASMIGEATARLLATEGAHVALTAPPSVSARLDTLATQIRDAGGQTLPLPADLGMRAQARALVRSVVDEWGRLDILIVADGYDAAADGGANGASARPRLGQPHPAVRGLLHVATAALPVMTRQGGGDIVAVAPVGSRVLRPERVASARLALEVAALCDALRRQAGPRGVRVAVVEPGLTPGPNAGNPASPTAEDVADAILFVLTQPPHVSINEILIQPTDQHA